MNQTTPTVRSTIPTVTNGAPAAPAATEAPVETPAGASGGESGVAPPSPEKPPESPPVAPPPETDKNLDAAQRFDKLARREAKARQAEVELNTLRSDLETQKKKLDEQAAEFERFMSDPVGYALEKGKDPTELAKRFVAAETEEQKRIRLLEEQLAADKKAREEETQKQKEAREERERFESLRTFVSSITPDDCPHLTALYEAPEIPALLQEFLHKPVMIYDANGRPVGRSSRLEAFRADYGRDPNDAEVREGLEAAAKVRATRILKQQAQPAAGSPAPEGSKQASASTDEGPKGISNRHSAETRAPSVAKKLTKEEQRLAKIEAMKADLRAEAEGEDA